METWIHGAEDMRPWCELIAEVAGYAFEDLDWDAVVAGMGNADRHKDLWFEYSFVGTETIHLRMAYDVWKDNVSVVWEAPAHLHPSIALATSIVQRFKLVPR
jgi:hypothetical protein